MIPDWLVNFLAGGVPPYSEQWATTYLQVLFESFLFALGVPTALYSLIVDEDIKHVAQTRIKAGRYLKVTALLYVAAAIIVWFLHPEPPNIASPQPAASVRPAEVPLPTTPVAQPTGQSLGAVSEEPSGRSTTAPAPVSPAVPENLAPLAMPADASTEQTTQPATTPGLLSLMKSVFAALTVTVLPIIVLLTGINLNKKLKRKEVVEHLATELLRSLIAKRMLDAEDLRERVTQKELCAEDLSYLGEHGRAGSEKKMVLDVIDSLAKRVQEKKDTLNLTYKGHELETLIRRIPAMLDNESRPGNDENYLRAGEVLVNIWRWLGPGTVTGDGIATRSAIKHLALRSVESTTEETAMAYLEIAAECDSRMVFEVGLAAIKAEKHSLAAGALTKLEVMVSDNHAAEKARREALAKLEALASADNPDENVRHEALAKLEAMASADDSAESGGRETMANLLGMVAQLAADGSAGSRRAEKALLLNEELFVPSLRAALTDAADYQFSAGRFRTADRVGQLLAQVGAMKTLDLDQPVAPRV